MYIIKKLGLGKKLRVKCMINNFKAVLDKKIIIYNIVFYH